MDAEIMKTRTKAFALRILRLVQSLPGDRICDVIGRQLLRSGTSVAANYRAACRARSTADFIAKMGLVEEEADESLFWLEMLLEARLVKQVLLNNLMKEADELVAIAVASVRTCRSKRVKAARDREHATVSGSRIRNPHSEIRNVHEV